MDIFVTTHAVETYKTRLKDERDFYVIADEIKSRVEKAFAGGFVRDQKTKAFRLHGEGKGKKLLAPNENFVWDGDVGWVTRDDNGKVVLTTVVRMK